MRRTAVTSEALQAIATIARLGGASDEATATAVAVLRDDGMVPTSEACRHLGVSRWTVRRTVERCGVRQQVRRGRQGSLVHLPTLRGVLGSKA